MLTLTDIEALQQGDRINHVLLGNGTVRGHRGHEDNLRLIIDFDDSGEKELLIAFCPNKIEKI